MLKRYYDVQDANEMRTFDYVKTHETHSTAAHVRDVLHYALPADWKSIRAKEKENPNYNDMKVELIIPIDKLRGALRKDGYYFRMYKDQQIVQRCPSVWKDTPARKAAREKFAQTWGKRYKG